MIRNSKNKLTVLIVCLLVLPALVTAQEPPEPPVSVVIGNSQPDPGETKPGSLNTPFGVDFDAQGIMWIAEYTGGRVLRKKKDGTLEVVAGNGKKGFAGDGGPASNAEFNALHNLAVSRDGSIFLSDHQNHAVRKLDSNNNTISSFAGSGKSGFSGDGGPASDASLNQVMCVTLTSDQEHLVVTDLKNRRIRSIDLTNNIISTIAGNGKRGVPENGALATKAPLFDPRAAAYDSQGNLYILERGGHALRVVRTDGKIETVAGTGKKGSKDGPALKAQMNGPKHLSIDPNNVVYIADDQNHLIRKYDPSTKTLTTVLGHGAWKLKRPHGVCVSGNELYIVDGGHHRILKIRL